MSYLTLLMNNFSCSFTVNCAFYLKQLFFFLVFYTIAKKDFQASIFPEELIRKKNLVTLGHFLFRCRKKQSK